jgi:hypothetical protein
MAVGAAHSGGYPILVPTDDKARGIDSLDAFEAVLRRWAGLQ